MRFGGWFGGWSFEGGEEERVCGAVAAGRWERRSRQALNVEVRARRMKISMPTS